MTLRVTGDVDLETSPSLTKAFHALSESGTDAVQLDLAGVTFLGLDGLGALVNAMLAGIRVEITAASRPVNRALELAGIPETAAAARLISRRGGTALPGRSRDRSRRRATPDPARCRRSRFRRWRWRKVLRR